MPFDVGDYVEKYTGDYQLKGEVRAVFTTSKRVTRYVVEHDNGILHIYNGNQLRPAERDPTQGLLMSMAIRYDHGLGVPGYYDQPLTQTPDVSHAQRLLATLTTMKQLHEEMAGIGFYRPEMEAYYADLLAETLGGTGLTPKLLADQSDPDDRQSPR